MVKIIKCEIYLLNPEDETQTKIIDVHPHSVIYDGDITVKEIKEQVFPSLMDDHRFSGYVKHKEEVKSRSRMDPLPNSVNVGNVPIVDYVLYLKVKK